MKTILYLVVLAGWVQASAQPMSVRDAAWMGLIASRQTAPLAPATRDWLDRIAQASGGRPSGGTVAAVDAFVKAVDAARLTSKMLSVNCFVPDNLTAATTPLYSAAWINTGFTSEDLSVVGLKNNASGSKVLLTDIVPSENPATANGMGFTFYISGRGWATDFVVMHEFSYAMDAGVGFSESLWAGVVSMGGYGIYFDSNMAGRGPYYTQLSGYWSLNIMVDTGEGQVTVYDANPGEGMELWGTTTAATTQTYRQFDQPVIVSGMRWSHDWPGYYAYTGDETLSFAAVHLPLTESEAASLWAAVQQLRLSLGGGLIPSW